MQKQTITLPLYSLLLDKSLVNKLNSKPVSQKIKNTKVTSRIKNKICSDENLRGTQVKVKHIQNTVVLSGTVNTRYQKIRAQRIAKNDKSVELIINSLKVKS